MGHFMQSTALVLTTKRKKTEHHIHTKDKRETEKSALAKRTIYTLIWPRKQSER